MSNTLVADCEGFLTDSGEDAEYGSNEFFVFTVVVPAAENAPIEITFLEEICIESGLDSLVIYDGPDVGSPVLGLYSGTGFTPTPISSTSGVVTFAFGSDNSVNLCGFSLAWETLAPPPEPPVAEVIQPFICPFSSAQIQFSPPLLCTDVDLESLTLLDAPLFEPSVICSGDTATGLLLAFDEPVSGNCAWSGSISLGVRDVCDSLFVFDVPLDLDISSCPVSVELEEIPAALCRGTCSELTFEASGCLAHDFFFSAVGASLSSVVADDSLGVTLTVCVEAGVDTVILDLVATQLSGGAGEFSWSWPVESPVWSSPFEGPSFYCSSQAGPVLAASPPGGTFSGEGPVSELGLVDASALDGTVLFSYLSLNGCAIDTSLVFELIDAGEDLTTCLGGADVLLEGNGLDASWSGLYTTSSGLFSPDSLGTWEIVFASASCSDTASVEVILQEPPIALAPICETAPEFVLPSMSDPGEWTGPGVLDAAGTVLPADIPPGLVTWSYVLTGCAFLAQGEVLPIAVEPDLVVTCPEQAGFVPAASALPAGGTWTGPGVLANSGFFSPAAAPAAYGLELIYEAPNGCTDVLEINNVQTSISPTSFATCAGLGAIELHESTDIDFAPWCGSWTGPGISGGAGCDIFWDPDLAGPGTHVIHFEANTCSDSIVIEVWPDAVPFTVADGTIFCELDDPVGLAPSDFPVGGTWSGADALGTFFPSSAAAGWNEVVWSPPGGCNDTLNVEVEAWAQATLGDLPDPWCFAAAAWAPSGLSPASSTWAIDGLTVTGFSMDTLAAGDHELTVSWAGEGCSSADTVGVEFQPALSATLTVADTLLCPETATTAEVTGSGGLDGAPYSWSWTHTDFPSSQTTYAPAASGYLVASLSDGCSDPAADSVWVEVAPVPQWQWLPAPLDCFGEPSVARLEVTPAHFDLAWAGELQTPADLVGTDTVVWALSATAGAGLPFELTDWASGCTHDTVLNIPSYSPVSAGFQANPGLGPDSACVPWELAPIAMLDFSSFVQQGVWWAEDEAGERVWSEVYAEGTSPLFAPPLPGGYTLFLAVENEGGCAAADTAWICVSAPTEWFLPDQFSPNGDGLNDRLRVFSEPLDRFEMQVFNRFGERVAVIDDPAVGWDGRQRGVDAPPGAYGIVLDMTFTTGVELSARATIRLIR